MYIALGIFLILHGIAHLVGFIGYWKLAKLEDFKYKTTLFTGKIDVGDVGIRIVGVFWLLLTIAYALSGTWVIMHHDLWKQMTIIVSIISLVFSISGWPDAKIGVFVNIAILVFLALNSQFGWMV